MRAFVVTDLEGVSGATLGGHGLRISAEMLAQQLALMMGESGPDYYAAYLGGIAVLRSILYQYDATA